MLWIESVPFIMMGFPKGLEMLSDYLIGQEIKNFDIGEVSRAINNALIGSRNNETSDDAYNLLTSGLPYLEGAGISWMAWLNEATSKNLMADAVADLDKMK